MELCLLKKWTINTEDNMFASEDPWLEDEMSVWGKRSYILFAASCLVLTCCKNDFESTNCIIDLYENHNQNVPILGDLRFSNPKKTTEKKIGMGNSIFFGVHKKMFFTYAIQDTLITNHLLVASLHRMKRWVSAGCFFLADFFALQLIRLVVVR